TQVATSELPRGQAAPLLEHLRTSGPQEASALTQEFSTARSILKKLSALGLVQLDRREQKSDLFFAHIVERDAPQQLYQCKGGAVQAITCSLHDDIALPYLAD